MKGVRMSNLQYLDCPQHDKEIRRALFKSITNQAIEVFHQHGRKALVRFDKWIDEIALSQWAQDTVIRITARMGLYDVLEREDYEYLYSVVETRVKAIESLVVTTSECSEFSDGVFASHG